jgi:hypothetical protein
VQLQVERKELLRHNYWVDKRDKSVLEVEKKEQSLELEVLRRDYLLEKEVDRSDLLRHSYLVDKNVR